MDNLKIGDRVYHFDGDPEITHGVGRVIEVNPTSDLPYRVQWEYNPYTFERFPQLAKEFPDHQPTFNYERRSLTLANNPSKKDQV